MPRSSSAPRGRSQFCQIPVTPADQRSSSAPFNRPLLPGILLRPSDENGIPDKPTALRLAPSPATRLEQSGRPGDSRSPDVNPPDCSGVSAPPAQCGQSINSVPSVWVVPERQIHCGIVPGNKRRSRRGHRTRLECSSPSGSGQILIELLAFAVGSRRSRRRKMRGRGGQGFRRRSLDRVGFF